MWDLYRKIVSKYPAFSGKAGYFHELFFIDPAGPVSYTYMSAVYDTLTFAIVRISILRGCVLCDINTEKIITT